MTGGILAEALLLQAKLAFTTSSVEHGAALLARAEQLSTIESEGELQALAVAIANCRARFSEASRRFEASVGHLRRAGLLRPLARRMLGTPPTAELTTEDVVLSRDGLDRATELLAVCRH